MPPKYPRKKPPVQIQPASNVRLYMSVVLVVYQPAAVQPALVIPGREPASQEKLVVNAVVIPADSEELAKQLAFYHWQHLYPPEQGFTPVQHALTVMGNTMKYARDGSNMVETYTIAVKKSVQPLPLNQDQPVPFDKNRNGHGPVN